MTHQDDTTRQELTDKEYIAELEKIVIFLCDVYSKGADSLACQVNSDGQANDKWAEIYMSFPTIQGTGNRMAINRIAKLRNHMLNREAPRISFQELYERLKVARKELNS